MKYSHRFTVNAPLAAVAEFHTRSGSMAAITPPPIVTRIHHAPARLAEGDFMDFTLWLGPVPIRWQARIEDATPAGFVDRQQRGPFRQWVHRHSFISVDQNTTQIIDDIELSLRPHPWWGLIGAGMALTLPLLFAYRTWQTRRLLADYSISENSDLTGV